MLALYRSDWQAEALDAFAEARHALVEEPGIEPSESMRRLQQAILRHDPALEAPGEHPRRTLGCLRRDVVQSSAELADVVGGNTPGPVELLGTRSGSSTGRTR